MNFSKHISENAYNTKSLRHTGLQGLTQ